ncbi:MAG: exodeoxyribonuclease VII small subunit [Coriobacteriia bacterium]|nr:exodeoxyribonuclease VII small subunit [Coriobacteriia bacterium]
MADEKYTYEQARIRLEEIAAEVRKKDTSLEKSLDLLEEGVRLANICTELVDHTDVSASMSVPAPEGEAAQSGEQAGEDEPVSGSTEEVSEAREAVVEGEPATEEDSPDSSDLSGDEGEGFEEADEDVEEPSEADVDA